MLWFAAWFPEDGKAVRFGCFRSWLRVGLVQFMRGRCGLIWVRVTFEGVSTEARLQDRRSTTSACHGHSTSAPDAAAQILADGVH
jgi:hypothetical protein